MATNANDSFIAAPEGGPRLPNPGANNVWYQDRGTDAVFIFVHGIFSDSRSCWLRETQPPVYWPDLVCRDRRFDRYSVYLGGYYTALDAGAFKMQHCADELHRALARPERPNAQSVIERDTIVFVCHSTGGIIVRYLLESRANEFKDKTVGLVLIASPSFGSAWATKLSWLSEFYSAQLARQLEWGNDSLDDLDDRFHRLIKERRIPRLHGVEAYENHFVFHRKLLPDRSVVVDKNSAGRYFAPAHLLAKTDHFTSVKPDSERHPAHELLVDFCSDLERCEHQREPSPSGPPVRLENAESALPTVTAVPHQWPSYDFFIAHAAADIEHAVRLYDLLCTKSRVFLDVKCLLLGDDWDVSIAESQRESAVTVVLVSSRSGSAYYQREEIAFAISMARNDAERHRVVPIFLDPTASSSADVPYGLRLKHGLHLPLTGSFGGIAQSLLDLKMRLEHKSAAKQLKTHTPSTPPLQVSPSIFVTKTSIPSLYAPEYFCYISQGKIDQLYSQIQSASFVSNNSLTAPGANRAALTDLISEHIPYGRPDLIQAQAATKEEYSLRLRAVLNGLDGSIQSFSWSVNPVNSAFYRFSSRFVVDAVDERQLMATLVAKSRRKRLFLDCSLVNFSHLTVSDGKPAFQSTNYAFFQKRISVVFDTVFVLLSQDKSEYHGSPLFLKLDLRPNLSL